MADSSRGRKSGYGRAGGDENGRLTQLVVLERFRADGLDVVDVTGAEDIRSGAGATLFGRPDFLVRAEILPMRIALSPPLLAVGSLVDRIPPAPRR
jgi:hypothetical protein